MSEKMQRTSELVREQMLARYGEEYHHKHNSSHRPYRRHQKTHPVLHPNSIDEDFEANGSKKIVRELKLRRLRTRMGQKGVH